MLTLTVRHSWGTELGALRKAVANAWRATWQGRDGAELRGEYAHAVRALDTTHGPNGWHPHAHSLILYAQEPPEEWRDRVAMRWHSAVVAELGEAAAPRLDDVGVRWDPTVRSDYLVKLGLEIAGGDKSARGAHELRADPWEIARRAAREYAHDPRVAWETHPWSWLWRDFAKAMKGAKALTWTRHAHRMAERAVEVQDPVDLVVEPWILAMSAADWQRTVEFPTSKILPSQILEASTHGPDEAERLLELAGAKPQRFTATDAAAVLSLSGGIYDEKNALARRALARAIAHQRTLQSEEPADRYADAG